MTVFNYPEIVRAAGDASYAAVEKLSLTGKERDIAYRALASEALVVALGRKYAREFYWSYTEDMPSIARRYVAENGEAVTLPTSAQMAGWKIDFNRGRVVPSRRGE
jgi:hypothetical protein